MKAASITPQFVEFIPATMQEGVLYISRKYETAAHKCCCGCGTKIVTPLKPTDWTLRVVGNLVTMHPSIGNWNHPCQSHYLIKRNLVVWAGMMSRQQIERGRALNRAAKEALYSGDKDAKAVPNTQVIAPIPPVPTLAREGLWDRFQRWLNS